MQTRFHTYSIHANIHPSLLYTQHRLSASDAQRKAACSRHERSVHLASALAELSLQACNEARELDLAAPPLCAETNKDLPDGQQRPNTQQKRPDTQQKRPDTQQKRPSEPVSQLPARQLETTQPARDEANDFEQMRKMVADSILSQPGTAAVDQVPLDLVYYSLLPPAIV